MRLPSTKKWAILHVSYQSEAIAKTPTIFDNFMSEYNFISDMGINIHLDRFDYGRVLCLLRQGKQTQNYSYVRSDKLYERFTSNYWAIRVKTLDYLLKALFMKYPIAM